MRNILKSAKEVTKLYMKELFMKNIKLDKVPLNENYLCFNAFSSNFEIIDSSKPITINQEYLDSHPEDEDIKRLLKKSK